MNTLYSGPITPRMINLATKVTLDTITCTANSDALLPPLQSFISHLAQRSRMNAATFLTTLVYLSRLNNRLPSTARGMPDTAHRIFLATFLLATKYHNDTSPKNKSWSTLSKCFSTIEVNLMERQLLFLLDYNLAVNEWELARYMRECCEFPVPVFAKRAFVSVASVYLESGSFCKKENYMLKAPSPVYSSRVV